MDGLMPYARVTNGFVDPQSGLALAQDQIVVLTGEENEWYKIQIPGNAQEGRCPKVLAHRLGATLRTNSERLVLSLAAFAGQEGGDLSFEANQLITVEKEIDSNWLSGVITSDSGKRLGKSGIFPASYVQDLPGVPVGVSHSVDVESVQSPRTAPSLPTMSARSTHTMNENIGPYGRSLYPFQGEFTNELSFGANEIVKLIRRVDTEWMEGEVNGQTGIFPANYVQIVVDFPSAPLNGTPNGGSKDDDGIGVATVKHAFEGREADELTVQAGDSVRVLRMVDNEWAQCREPLSDTVGIIPIAFLEMYLDDDVEEMAENVQDTMSSTNAWNSSSLSGSSAPPAFSGSFDRPLGSQISNDFGLNHTGGSSSWARFDDWDMAKEPDEKKPPPMRPPPPKANNATTPEDSAWASFTDTPPRAPGVTPSNSMTLSTNATTTNAAERTRVINELIQTENAFCTDMQALEKAVTQTSKLSEKYKRVLSNGIPQLVELSLLLADTLKMDLEEPVERQKIGEIFMNMQKMFTHAYGFFFRNIEYIHAVVENKSDKKLQAAMTEVLGWMRTYGSFCFDVPTAVSRPVHRALKYPLFLSEIIKYTSTTHPDHPKLLEAFKQMSNLGQKMNESKRRKELMFQTVDSPQAEVLLSRKYSEEQSATLTQKLSRLSVHSVVKKSNRFKYRMGSAIGILHLTRDPDFEQMVSELDQCERRLVRFNYQLVIYQKKLQHDMKRQIEVLIVAPNASRMPEKAAMQQLKPFFEILQEFVKETNYKVKDDCLKAIRVIPKRLIAKRNDKLMDYEAAKSGAKLAEEMNARFRDFDALNQQVKTTVPKVIDVMNQVLKNGMATLEEMDAGLMRTLKDRFELEQQRSTHLLITPSTICFVDLMDKNRLNPLRQISTKAVSNLRPLKSSMKKRAKAKHTEPPESKPYVPTVTTIKWLEASTSSATPATTPKIIPTFASQASLDEIWKGGRVSPREVKRMLELFKQFDGQVHANGAAAPPPAPPVERRFRGQTDAEKKVLLEKADARGRRSDVFRCVSEWPASLEAREASEKTGRMLIVKTGDAVLAVRKEERGLWYCYNGFYNGLLPSGILMPFYERPGTNIGEPFADFGLLEQRAAVATERPKSTPPVKNTNNLIDLLDDIIPPSTSVAPLQPQVLQPTPTRSLYPSLTGQQQQAPKPVAVNEPPPINWGATSMPAATPSSNNGFDAFAQPLAPIQTNSLFDSISSVPLQPSPAPSMQALTPTMTSSGGLPPMHPQPNGASSRGTNRHSINDDGFSWDSFNSTPLSKMRSESPQPLVPSRPTYDQPPAMPVYEQPPALSASNPFAAMQQQQGPPLASYDQPPLEPQPLSARVAPQLPQNSGAQKTHPMVMAEYDFQPVGDNQLLIREGERLQLLQRHDDDGNTEWFLVKRASGEQGYVPAAYLKDL